MNPIHLEAARKIITRNTTVFWFRRDLRLHDNAGLFHALQYHGDVIALFIFDTDILSTLEDRADRRVHFIHRSLQALAAQLEALGSSLVILHGVPADLFRELNPGRVYTNNDYEPYAVRRDDHVQKILKEKNSVLHSFKDHVIFEKSEIVKENGEPYTVYTPYSKKWKASLHDKDLLPYDSQALGMRFMQMDPLPMPSLADIGFQVTDTVVPEASIQPDVIRNYSRARDYPALRATSRLSVHLRFGTVSIRNAVAIGKEYSEVWLNELIWREFYQMILWHFPHVEWSPFKAAYNSMRWRDDEGAFAAWCSGSTGYPIVDAGMRELNATGFMHNRVRMITASFLTKHLLIDYRWGEAYFAKKLLDYDLAANNGGWQWAAGSGCDAVPYFRVFNPSLQQEKFDKDGRYVRQWVPEAGTTAYPKPIVEHAAARKRALDVYKRSLSPDLLSYP